MSVSIFVCHFRAHAQRLHLLNLQLNLCWLFAWLLNYYVMRKKTASVFCMNWIGHNNKVLIIKTPKMVRIKMEPFSSSDLSSSCFAILFWSLYLLWSLQLWHLPIFKWMNYKLIETHYYIVSVQIVQSTLKLTVNGQFKHNLWINYD